MAAAYAALASLLNTMENMQNHPRLSTLFDKKQIESLSEKVDFLLDFMESYNSHGGTSKEAEDLERQIASAAREAEDVIETHITDRIKEIYSMLDLQKEMEDIDATKKKRMEVEDVIESHITDRIKEIYSMLDIQEEMKDIEKVTEVQEKIQSEDEKSHLKKVMKDMDATKKKSMEVKDVIGKSTISMPDLRKVIENMDSIKEKVMEAKEERAIKDQLRKSPMREASSRPLTTGKTTMVGFDNYLVQLLDWLTGQQSDRQIISITGMGGIGKTMLARNIYKNLLIAQHFDVLVWVTISQEYNVKEILRETLSCLRGSTGGMDKMFEYKLGEELHKSLWGRRYLVILDDIWNIEAWDKIKFFFPDNCNRSRIVVTTRISNLAHHFGSLGLALDLLDGDQSWNLFCQEVFGQEGCPLELEKIGKQIAEKCKGLPLSITAIGGLLTQLYWKEVVKDSSILNSTEDNRCWSILYLSYSHLSVYLKPCFLYLGIFPEDHEIHFSRLIKLWIAEGLLKPNKEQSLKEIAKGYIKDLVERNLILGGIKTCKIHDLLRDLCIRVAEKEKFFCVRRVLYTGRDIDMERCTVINVSGNVGVQCKDLQIVRSSISLQIVRSKSLGYSLVLTDQTHRVDSLVSIFRFPIHLRFLAYEPVGLVDLSHTYELPSSIPLLWNVQTLIIKGKFFYVTAPPEIWEMPNLRHLDLYRISLPYPPSSGEKGGFVLRNLQTLRSLLNFTWSEVVCKRMPNIKRLRLVYEDCTTITNCCLHNTGSLTKLESLGCHFEEVPNRDDLMQNLMFPRSLKKLSLSRCGLHWEDLTIIGSLAHLEELKLFDAVDGLEWHPVEGKFLRLKCLEIYGSSLIYWHATSFHYPVLENLILVYMYQLDEIPLGIGDIATLQSICVSYCSISLAFSAIKILEEQESLGNQGLQVEIRCMDQELKELRKKVEQEGITSCNFQIIKW